MRRMFERIKEIFCQQVKFKVKKLAPYVTGGRLLLTANFKVR